MNLQAHPDGLAQANRRDRCRASPLSNQRLREDTLIGLGLVQHETKKERSSINHPAMVAFCSQSIAWRAATCNSSRG